MLRAKIQTLSLHVFWFILLALSVHFYQERTFADTAYFLFKVINEGTFHIQHGRWVLAISQAGAVVAISLGLSLKKVLLIHSVYHALFFYGITAWLLHIIKNKRAAWLFTLLMVSGHWAYFSPYLEVFYAAGFATLFFAAFANSTHFEKYYLVYYPLLWLSLMAHPSFFLIVGAHFITLLLSEWKFTDALKSFGLFLLSATLVKLLSFSAYEQQRLQTLSNEVVDWGGVVSDLLLQYSSHYLSAAILFFAVPILLLLAKKYKLALFSFFSYLFLIALAVINLKNGDYKWYNEVMLLPFTLLLMLPLISFNLQWNTTIKSIVAGFLLILLGWNLSGIFDRGELLRFRYQQMQSIASEAKDLHPEKSKFILEDDNYERSFTQAGMQLPYEFFLASSEYGPQNTVAIALNQMMKVDSSKEQLKFANQVLYWGFAAGPIGELDSNYFKVIPSSYQSLHQSPYNGQIQDYIAQTELSLIDYPSKAEKEAIISPIVGIGMQDLILPSDSVHNIHFAYHIYSAEGEEVVWDGKRTPLEVDIKFNYQQRVEVLLPDEPGQYKVIIDLVKEGERWFEKGVEFMVSID